MSSHRAAFHRRSAYALAAALTLAACGADASDRPASPTAPSSSRAGAGLPFRGSLTSESLVPPPNAVEVGEGTASHLGRFTVELTAAVTAGAATGTMALTAANGDQLFATFVGQGEFIPPNVARLVEVATIVGGTGRFEGATGTFTMVRVQVVDFATGLGSGDGSFDGRINLAR